MNKKEFIISQLNSQSLSEEIINKIYDIFQTFDEKEFITYFKSKGIEDVFKTIELYLKHYGEIHKIREIIQGQISLPSSRDLLENNNIYDLFKNLNISKSCLEDISNIITPKNNINRGRFEVLLQLLLSDITIENKPINSNKGDVYTGSGSFELKCPLGRIKGQTGNSPQKIDEKFNEILKEKNIHIEFKNVFGSQKNIRNTFDQLKELTQEELIDIIGRSLINQFTEDPITIKEWIDFLNKYKNDFIQNNTIDAKGIQRFIGTMDMYFYQKSENWNYMMIFTGKNNKQIDGSYICINQNQYNSFESIYNIKEIHYIGYPSLSTRSREWVCEIIALK